ncbi:radical SAM family heme chaperone HemW [[Clostridium] polysaccharolyticum]|uniref:Heme chaperone HemW n=1 Tax=[Clostridium] polysaccharolyticum TaxID=29364 RepID=A0A1H9ZPV5_9FIRM|nr:radical SAM family heme chaperone HemW [[Clostridium] polysaccharolyticum]SES83720.1 oxygen-independent coproporphyrinogen-3 oxidase [[Clostridium] polysaccharolyticum]
MKELAIYVHIPFCARKCRYCDFLSGPEYLEQIDQYIDMMQKQMEQCRELVKEYRIRSIFLGGGTPSILTSSQITRVMAGLWELAGDRMMADGEVTIESNPGTLTEEKLKTYLDLKISRISMGLQSADNEELKNLGRIHTYEEFLEGYKLARKAGFNNINVDLMSGLPSQTLQKWETTLKKVISLRPEHISAYSLIVEEGTEFYKLYGSGKGKKELPEEGLDRLMYQKTKELLEQAGYYRYEISNYAKPGYESRHNITYWTGIDYLGIGLGASSLIQKKRYRNEEKMECYLEKLSRNKSVCNLEEALNWQSEMEEFMILGLRMMKGVSKSEFQKRFGVTMESKYESVLRKIKELGLMEEEKDLLWLTEKGIDVSNEVFTLFLSD